MHTPTSKASARRRPRPQAAERAAALRGKDAAVSRLPPLKLPASDVADRGIVRLGSVGITSER